MHTTGGIRCNKLIQQSASQNEEISAAHYPSGRQIRKLACEKLEDSFIFWMMDLFEPLACLERGEGYAGSVVEQRKLEFKTLVEYQAARTKLLELQHQHTDH
jgi:hypothetical protein